MFRCVNRSQSEDSLDPTPELRHALSVREHSRYFRNFAISLFRKNFKYTTFSFFCTYTLSHLIADKLDPTCRRNSFLLKVDRSFCVENNYK